MARLINYLAFFVVLTYLSTHVKADAFDNKLQRAIKKGIKWVLSQREKDWGWVQRGNAEVIMSLQLANPDWYEPSQPDSSVSVKQMNIDLLSALVKYGKDLDTATWFGGKLGQYVTGVIATCQDPRDFYGTDLVALLKSQTSQFPKYTFNNNFSYSWAILGLCSAKETIPQCFIDQLTKNAGGPYPFGVDEAAITAIAMSCLDLQNKRPLYKAVQYLYTNRKPDGSFGNEFSTALAAQALIASGKDRQNAVKEAQEFLLTKQGADGSFQNLLAAHQILPAFATTSFAAVKDMDYACLKAVGNPPNFCDPPVTIHIQVENTIQPPTFSKNFTVSYKEGASLFEFMKELAQVDPTFTFTYQKSLSGAFIKSLLGLAGSGTNRTYFKLLKNGTPSFVGVSALIPGGGDDIKFEFTKY